MTEPEGVRWPERFAPENCPVHVRNELAMSAPVARVWAWLIRAQLWPTWYENSANVQFLEGPPPDLALGTRFRWRTFSVTVESTVVEFIPMERIAWDARTLGLEAYHAWVLRETPEGCHVVTEETQRGSLARLGDLVLPNRMSKHHQIWLERMEIQARAGFPPPV